MHAFWAFLSQGFRQQAAYKVEGWMGMISSLIWLVLYASIWTALLRGDPAALKQQMGYIIASRFLAELNFLPTWEVTAKFRLGDVGLELIKPVALPVRVLADFLGRSAFRLLRALPIFVVVWIAFHLKAPTLSGLLLFVVTGLIGWVINASLSIALSLVALWTVQFDEAEQLFGVATSLFSGAFIPLYYLPGWIGQFAKFLPFAGIYFVPSAILSGGLVGGALWQALGLQVFWAVVSVGVISAMWSAGSRKLVMQGG
jgi:ABC-2 type transport system permease protein